MTGHAHYPEDGNTWAVPAGTRGTCAGCRRAITFVAGHDRRRDYWRASGKYGPPLSKSRRCTSRNPAVGYLGCDLLRNHSGACRGADYVWYRGRGHSRPFLISRPAWETAGGYR